MKNSKYILAGMSAFCLVLITATSIKSSFLMPLRTGVGFVLVPLQSGVNAIGAGLYNALENFSSLREAQEENKNLQMRLDQMVEENNRLQSELYELDRLRELYQLDQEYMQYKNSRLSLQRTLETGFRYSGSTRERTMASRKI